MKLLGWAFVVVLAIGCGSTPGPESPTDMTVKQRLSELNELWSLAQMDLKRPPASIKDLEKYQRAGGFAYQAVASGDLKVYWGGAIGQGGAILAYEKEAPNAGGWVLLQDRSIKQVTAAEFQSTPKAGK